MFKSAKQKSFFWGVVAGLGMSGFYLIIMFLTMKTAYVVWDNFVQFWYLIIGLVIGFGVQIGLWVYLKNYPSHKSSSAVAGVSGATSGSAMLACCMHHLADILPILGLAGAAAWATQYQRPMLILGLSINILGIVYMLRVLEKHKRMKC
jgi:hypothetical protein